MSGVRQNRIRFSASIRLCAAALLVALCTVSGCFFGTTGGSPTGQSNAELTPKPLTAEGRRMPLTLTDREVEEGGRRVLYPHICDDGMELLDMAVRGVCMDFAAENSGSTGYEVKYNNCGLLSIKLYAFDEGGAAAAVSSATFDCDSGRQVRLSDCMGRGDTSYRFSMADTVTARVTAEGHTVLSYLPPIDDSRLFYVTGGGIVLLYRMYEICGAEAGFPEVEFAYPEIERYLGPDALLLRLPYFGG